jgi:hypothetical protein
MPSYAATLWALSLVGLINGQAVIASAKGDSAVSKGLFVNQDNTKDANFISQAEIVANVVNECGRTLQGGNIDIGEQTEIELEAGQVTQVSKGSTVEVTISQRDAKGAGPFQCDMDLTSNSNGAVGQTPLAVTQSVSYDGKGDVTIQVALPADMACTGASTGNVCTVRCRNANSFGGCFAVQQTDTQASKNDASTINTAQTLDGVLKQVQQNVKDLPAAISGLAAAKKVDDQGVAIADALFKVNPDLPGSAGAGTGADAGNNNGNNGNNGNGNGNNGNNQGGNGNNRGGNGGNRGGNRGGNNGNGNGNNAGNNANNRGQAQNGNGNQKRGAKGWKRALRFSA